MMRNIHEGSFCRNTSEIAILGNHKTSCVAVYILLIIGFISVLTSGGLLSLGLGQVAFGLAVGSLYYASLFYSMNVGEAHAKHGGIHVALMGAGNFIGPGIGALSLLVAPHSPHAGVWSVSGLMALGLAMLVATRRKYPKE
jgi:MFS family permease